MANYTRDTLYYSQGSKALGVVFVAVNLLSNTLAGPSLPPGKQVSASAPVAQKVPSCEQQINRLPLGIPAPLTPSVTVRWLSDSAPRGFAVQTEQQINRLPLSVVIQNPSVTTARLSNSAPQVKYQNQTELPPRPITLGI